MTNTTSPRSYLTDRCATLRALDLKWGTVDRSPLHHDNNCTIQHETSHREHPAHLEESEVINPDYITEADLDAWIQEEGEWAEAQFQLLSERLGW